MLALPVALAWLFGCGRSREPEESASPPAPEIPSSGLTLSEGCHTCGGPLRPVPVQDASADPKSEEVHRGEALPAMPDANPWAAVCDTCRLVRTKFRGAWEPVPEAFRKMIGERRDDNSLAMGLRWCPPGTYMRGSPADEFGHAPDENRVQATNTRGFWIGEYEVTQAQWKAVMGRTLREQRAKSGFNRALGDGSTRDHAGEGPDYPIYFVSHVDATAFCAALNESERSAGKLPAGYEYALPTESQWEYACRAGSTAATPYGATLASTNANFDGTVPYNAGDQVTNTISFKMIDDDPRPDAKKKVPAKGQYLKETTPVGKYPPNNWGLHDMLGNVSEWCRDGYTDHLGDGLDPIGPATNPRRVFRGGSWSDVGVICRSAGTRTRMRPENSASGLGFRVALVPTKR